MKAHRLLILLTFVFATGVFLGEGAPRPGSFIDDDPFKRVGDVLTGRRGLEIKGNIMDGTLQVSTGPTNEEILMYVAVAGGILLFLVCCGICCKHVCCPRRSPTVIMYQQMPPPAHQLPQSSSSRAGAAISPRGIPMRTPQGFTEMQTRGADYNSPPPPYPGISG